jgi:hypothetical protein
MLHQTLYHLSGETLMQTQDHSITSLAAPDGGKKIAEAVIIAALSAAAAGLISWAIEEIKSKVKGKAASDKKEDNESK